MLVSEWMSKMVFSIDVDASLSKAIKLQKECNVNMFPVLDDGKLVGIITDRDIKRASISDTMPLDINEAIYLASTVPVRDVMTPNPVTIPSDYTIEEAAEILLSNKIAGAPVLDKNGNMVGVMNRSDILKVVILLTSSKEKGFQYALRVKDKSGSVSQIVHLMRDYGCRFASLLTTYHKVPAGLRDLYIRVYDIKKDVAVTLIDKLNEIAQVRYVVDTISKRRRIITSKDQ
ncbi:MAG: CBS domain-containing protein [Deltaproteobacteria bacterium]|nr:CBS domain-containing protein [Deltaproteobacteria bacterium]